MLYREIIAVCSQIHTKHIHTLCGQDTEFLNVVHTVSLMLQIVNALLYTKCPNSALPRLYPGSPETLKRLK